MRDIIDLTRKLISFPTMHKNPAEIRKCADFIEAYLTDCGAVVQRSEAAGIPSICCMPTGNCCRVLLMTHMDVVDGPAALFQPREENGKLYGRGAIDDKYAVALSMVLFREYLQRLQRKGRAPAAIPFGILITGDEEIGGKNGAKRVLADLQADFCIALDGGGVGKMVVQSKGILQLQLVEQGVPAHGARPWLGENAIEKLIADYHRIRDLFADADPTHWHRTLNFSVVRAGGSVNQVPGSAEAMFDIRYTEDDDVDDLLARMRERIQGELHIHEREPMFTGGDSPYRELLMEIAKDTKTVREHGASDARFLSLYDIPGVVWGADGEQSQHALDEHVDIESVYKLYHLLDEFFNRLEFSTE